MRGSVALAFGGRPGGVSVFLLLIAFCEGRLFDATYRALWENIPPGVTLLSGGQETIKSVRALMLSVSSGISTCLGGWFRRGSQMSKANRQFEGSDAGLVRPARDL